METGKILAICISSKAGGMLHKVKQVKAIAGKGLEGDRYCTNNGSFNKKAGDEGKRQVTLINGLFFEGSGFNYEDSRRNIITEGVELMYLIGKEFQIGEAIFKGVKYCDPCTRPSKLSGNSKSFKEVFYDRGGLIAEIIKGGTIKVLDSIIPPYKGY